MRLDRAIVLALCIMHCALCIAADAQRFVIAEGGMACAAIVVPQNAPKSATYAARQLAKYLGQMSGTSFAISGRPLKGLNTIRVGFPHDGPQEEISISIPRRDLMEITGEGPRGPAYAVFYFLETLGCGFWNLDFETVPIAPDISVPVGYTRREAPAMLWRDLSTQVRGDIDGCLKLRANGVSCISDRNWIEALGAPGVHEDINHSFIYRWLKPGKGDDSTFARHPDWFALIEPGSTNRSSAAICPSSKGAFEAVCSDIEAYLAEHPQATSVSLSPADTATFCRCPECEKAVAADPAHVPTALYIDFANRVSRRFAKLRPRLHFNVLSYWSTGNPPASVHCDPNVSVAYALLWRNHGRPITSCERFSPNIEAWQRAADSFYYWDYYANFSDYIAPFPNWDIVAPSYKFYAEHKFRGGFAQTPNTPNTPLGDLNIYMINRLQWNPALDPDALASNYIENVYGPAAQAVRDFRDFTISCRDRQRWLWLGCYIRGTAHFLSADDCIRYFNLSKAVETKLARDPRRRLNGFRFPISAYELLLFRYNDVLAVATALKFKLPPREELWFELRRRWTDSGLGYGSDWAEREGPRRFVEAFLKEEPRSTPNPEYTRPVVEVPASDFNDNGAGASFVAGPDGGFARFTPEKSAAPVRVFMDTKGDCIAWTAPSNFPAAPYYCFAEMRVDARAANDNAAAYFGIYDRPLFNGLALVGGSEEIASMRVEREAGDLSWRLESLGRFPVKPGSKVYVMAGFVTPPGDTDVRRLLFVRPDILEGDVSEEGATSRHFGANRLGGDKGLCETLTDRFDRFRYLRVRAPGRAAFDVPKGVEGRFHVFARVRSSVREPLVFDAARFTIAGTGASDVPLGTARISGSAGELPWQLIWLGEFDITPGTRIALENTGADFTDWRDVALVKFDNP